MKKWLVILLVFITAAGSFIPCSQDDCLTGNISSTSQENKEEHQDNCPPFFTCAACTGSVEITRPLLFVQPLVEKQEYYENIFPFQLSAYAPSFWQPPRNC